MVRAPTVKFSAGGITTGSVTVVNDGEVTASYTASCDAVAQNVALQFPSDGLTTNSLALGTSLPAAPAPSITFNGNTITTTQSVVVGQKIALTGNIPSLPPCLSVSSESWSLSGSYPTSYVGGYSHSLDSGGYSEPTLNQLSTTFYWITQGNSQNAVLTLNYNTGQHANDQASFNVSGPTSVSMDTPTTGVLVYPDGSYLGFGDYPNTLGIQFIGSATPPSGDSGNFFYEQLIGTYNVTRSATCSYSLGTGLDTSDPYVNNALSTNDSPRTPLYSTESEVTADFSGTTYLMWQSGTSGSIPVSLGYVNWEWSGDAVQNSGTWSLNSGSNSTNPPFIPSSAYPTWNTHYTPAPPPCQ